MPYRPRLNPSSPLLAALLGLGALAWSSASHAAPVSLKPGLWDYALQTRNGDGPTMNLAQMLRNLPASTRPQVEARLRAQGMSLSPDGTLQICLDAASLADGHPPLHLGGRCAAHWEQTSPGDWHFRYACQDPAADGRGSLRVTAPTAYESDYTVKNPQGSMSGQAQAHWVADSCGGVPALRENH